MHRHGDTYVCVYMYTEIYICIGESKIYMFERMVCIHVYLRQVETNLYILICTEIGLYTYVHTHRSSDR